jgi:uncharacterized surface protein with fasciclin (FAS1) repeats
MADIVDTAVGAGNFKTLTAAVSAAGLASTLKGAGPFTVFAPTDAAFSKLPFGTVDALLKDIPTLTKILTYHVVPGKVTSDDVGKLGGKKVKTVNGKDIRVTVVTDSYRGELYQNNFGAKHRGAGVKINNAKVVTADILCDNGVIHIVDQVIIPKDNVFSTTSAKNRCKKTNTLWS